MHPRLCEKCRHMLCCVCVRLMEHDEWLIVVNGGTTVSLAVWGLTCNKCSVACFPYPLIKMSLICTLFFSASPPFSIFSVCIHYTGMCICMHVYVCVCVFVRVPVYASSGLGPGRDNEIITLIKPLQTEWSSLFFALPLYSSQSLLLLSLPQHLSLRLIPWLILPATQMLLPALMMKMMLLLLKHRVLILLYHVANAAVSHPDA